MALESATYISQLNASDPTANDPRSQGDDHLRLIKSVLQTTFPNASGAIYFPIIVDTKTADYTIVAPSDGGKIIPFDCSSGAVTATLPTVGLFDGFSIQLLKSDFGPNDVTISGNGKTVNGLSSILLEKAYQNAYLTYSSTLGAWLAKVDPITPTGTFVDNGASTLNGYVLCDGATTLGDASSGATVAADYCQALFEHLWNRYAGLTVSSGRGSSSSADWAAHKKITVPDLRGRSRFGRDNMGTAASRITNSGTGNTGVDGATLGTTGGSQSVLLAQSALPNTTLTVSGSISGTAASSGAHTHVVFSQTTAQATGTNMTASNSAAERYDSQGGDFSADIGSTGDSPTVGRTSSSGAHTHSVSGTCSGSTASMNGNVTQTYINKLPPLFITNVFIAF
jgi:hypothetical protein